MKKMIVLAAMAMLFGNAFAAEKQTPLQSGYCNNALNPKTLYAYATYQVLLEAMTDVPQGSTVVVRYAKFKESPENVALNEKLKDLVVDILVKAKKYKVIRDVEMAPENNNYYEVYVLADYLPNPYERYDDPYCEGSYCYAKAEITYRKTGEVVGSARKQEQLWCGGEYDQTTSSFRYIRFVEDYRADW